MSYEPLFMKGWEKYIKDQSNVKTKNDWIEFRRKWYDEDEKKWPKKTPQQRAEESTKKRGPIKIGGRTLVHVSYPFDLTSEARYELMKTSTEIGLRLVLPNGYHSPQESGDNQGWMQECPYCEIATHEIGDENCPICTRKMIYIWVGD